VLRIKERGVAPVFPCALFCFPWHDALEACAFHSMPKRRRLWHCAHEHVKLSPLWRLGPT
jgi:hypothetical protein